MENLDLGDMLTSSAEWARLALLSIQDSRPHFSLTVSSFFRSTQMTPTLADRYRGCLLGLACGDAVGTTLEFSPRGSFPPLTDMIGGGPCSLKPGQWTDDTSMALCLATSLLECAGFDARDQMTRYLKWMRDGYLSSTGRCFDIGLTVRDSLLRFEHHGEPFAGKTDPNTAGNGSIMRLAPVPLYFFPVVEDAIRFSAESSRTTHGAPEAVECCMLLARLLCSALGGSGKRDLLIASDLTFEEPNVAAIAMGSYLRKSRDEITGNGYAVASIEAAIWCFHTTDNLRAAILTAANLGDDADTTAAIAGQIAGAYYGVKGIPDQWLAKLHMRSEIEALADGLLVAHTLPQQQGSDNR